MTDSEKHRVLLSRAQYSHLNSHCFCRMGESCYALANYDRCAEDYSPTNYWRGPVWVNINWMLYQGLKAYGYEEYARYVKNSIVKLVEQSGFHEYFEPFEGKGLGTDNFSWTAALLIDLLAEERGDSRLLQ